MSEIKIYQRGTVSQRRETLLKRTNVIPRLMGHAGKYKIYMIPIVVGFLLLSFMLRGASSGFLEQYQKSLGDMSNAAVEYVRGISLVKVFGQTVYSFNRNS